jgi:uracil-DNA glycosylase
VNESTGDSVNSSVSESKLFQVMGLGPLWEPRYSDSRAPQHAEVDKQEASIMPLPTEAIPTPLLTLEDLENQVSACEACGLCKTRKQTVFSAGVARSDLMVIGEAPGADEDAQGQPFVGRAGQLLDKMLKSVDRSRGKNVYIANVLKCRPPGNRNPEPAEIASCSPYLRQQIELNKPKALLLVGSFAIRTLLNTQEAVGKVRGRVHQVEVGGIKIPAVASYHPAYLLRNPVEKRKSWEDLQLLRSLLAD